MSPINHEYVSAQPDSGDGDEVSADEWNADHDVQVLWPGGMCPIGRSIIPGYSSSSVGTLSSVQNRIWVTPFAVAMDMTFDEWFAEVSGTGVGNFKLVIYENEATADLWPGDLLLESTNLDPSTSGIKVEGSLSQALVGGKIYWFGFMTDAATFALRTMTRTSGQVLWDVGVTDQSRILHGSIYSDEASYAVPDPFPSSEDGLSAEVPLVGFGRSA